MAAMQTQSETRVKKRIHCTLEHESRHGSGLILNLSPSGIFVQTTQPAEPGTRVAIDFIDPEHSRPIELETAVVWRRRISPHMTGLNQSGMGLRLIDAPPEYRALVAKSAQPPLIDKAPREERPTGVGPLYDYVVRLGRSGGPRTRHIKICAPDMCTARSEALQRAGKDWDVVEISMRNDEPEV